MNIYFEYLNENAALTASAAVYDLNAPPRDQRGSLYAYNIAPHTGSEDKRCVVIHSNDIQTFQTGSVFEGVTSYTRAEAIAAGFDIGDEE